jgi:hypothetical protein
MCFYDKSKTKISYSENGSTNDLTKTIVEIPTGTVYIRVSFLTNNTPYYMVVRGNADMVLPNFESYTEETVTVVPKDLNKKLAEIDELWQTVEDQAVEQTVETIELIDEVKSEQPNLFAPKIQTGNLLDVSLLVDGEYINSSGNIGTNANAVCTEEYIDISKAVGTHIAMYKCNANTLSPHQTYWRMCFYDKSKTKISYSENGSTNDLTKTIVEIPTGAVYIRVSFLTNNTPYYMVVRGNADMALPSYEPPKTVTVVPANLNEKLADIDEIKSDFESAKIEKHQDDAEFTITTLNKSNQFSQNDITFVGDELWVSKENPVYYNNGTMIFRYKVVDGEFTLVGTCDCDFGHLNTMDYCSANDCLIFGNGANGEETTGNYFVVVKNPLSLGETALIADVGIKYDVDIGFKVQALWGDSNLGDNNIVYLLSNNSANITKVLLLKDDNGEFNGEFVTLESHEVEVFGVQGADIFGDTLYIGGQVDGEYSAVKEISLSDYTTTRIVKRKFYKADGSVNSTCVQGIYVNSDSVWICVNSGDTNKPVCLTKYRR